MTKTEKLNIILNDKDRKSIPQMIIELIHCVFLEKEIPFYYFTCLLYKQGAPDYRHFIGDKKRGSIIDDFYFKNGENPNLENKLKFNEILEEHNVQAPKILADNQGYLLNIESNKQKIKNEKELIDVLKTLIHKTQNKSIFIKRNTGLGGLNTFKFNMENVHDMSSIKKLFDLMENTNFIFQETIFQHDEVNKIYPESINTVRVHAAVNAANEVEIISALMRFGTNGNVADNVTAGGFFVPVNTDDWSLEEKGSTFFKNGASQYVEHPDTKYNFGGFKIPYGDQIENEIKKVAKLYENTFVGWDIAISNKGPLVIEGNDNPHVHMAQMACGGFKVHEGFKKVFAEYL